MASPKRSTSSYKVGTSYEVRLASPLALFFVVFFLTPLVILFVLSLRSDPQGTSYGVSQYIQFLGDAFSWACWDRRCGWGSKGGTPRLRTSSNGAIASPSRELESISMKRFTPSAFTVHSG
jgi:ABC-type sugar transport system permease subunit